MKRLVLVLLLSTGCVLPEGSLRKQAAFDTKCPEENVKVLEWGPNYQSAKVDACGQSRSYHDVTSYSAAGQSANWVEVK